MNGPLRSVDDGANGVYAAGLGSFPTETFVESNYFVDVVVRGPRAADVRRHAGRTARPASPSAPAPAAVFSRATWTPRR